MVAVLEKTPAPAERLVQALGNANTKRSEPRAERPRAVALDDEVEVVGLQREGDDPEVGIAGVHLLDHAPQGIEPGERPQAPRNRLELEGHVPGVLGAHLGPGAVPDLGIRSTGTASAWPGSAALLPLRNG